MKNLLIGLLLVLLPLGVLQAQSQVEMNAEAAARFEKYDKELNAVYQKVLQGQDDEGKKKLKLAQAAWIKFRDAEADLEADAERGGSLAKYIYLDTQANLTKDRVAALKKYLGDTKS